LLKEWPIKSRAVEKSLRGLSAERKERVIEVAVDCSEAGGAGDVEGSLLRPARLMRRLSVGSVNSEIEEELILMLIR
jgi:hypothetical protein